jgi:hypothetical protein
MFEAVGAAGAEPAVAVAKDDGDSTVCADVDADADADGAEADAADTADSALASAFSLLFRMSASSASTDELAERTSFSVASIRARISSLCAVSEQPNSTSSSRRMRFAESALISVTARTWRATAAERAATVG